MWLNYVNPSCLLEPGLRRENPVATINLDVIFPERVGGVPQPPIVIPEHAVAKQFDRINWTVYAVDPTIASAEIEFAGGLLFFGTQSSFKRKTDNGKAKIYADVPDLGKNQPVGAKYTVRGLDSTDTKIIEVDPVIIVDEP